MYTIAIDLGGTNIKTGLLDRKNLIASTSEKATSGKGLKNNLPLIEKMIDYLLENQKLSTKDLLGIGFSFAGMVDSAHNRVISTNKKYDDAPYLDLPRWAKEKWNLPLYMENDARMALLGEWQHGAGKGYDNIVIVTLGTGIGSAVLIEGKLLRGKHFQAGNLGGHFTINYQGTVCTCGNIGCMESEASTWRLPELIRNYPSYHSSSLANEKILDFEALFRNVAKNDSLAVEVLDHCFSVWSAGIITMIHAYDPEIVILSGGIMKSASIILPELQERVNQYAWTPWGKVKLIKAENIETSALYGGDYLVRLHQQEQKN
ncbi:MAG TPA: ROK family protein [Paludibacteraceae bacterium]|nr:ROK family protein [Paludibacteraceae bacterium]HRU63072.1 ROK family protein [Paludibacteraceae bacterium]